jgi:hypothetical protein
MIYFKKEMELLRQEKHSLIMPLVVFLVIAFLLLFGCGDSRANNQIIFQLQPQKEWSRPWKLFDIDRLALAVSYAETGGCKDGTALKRNNCHGIMDWKNGKRSPRWFNSQQDSFETFKSIWLEHYKCYPTIKEAIIWTGNDKPYEWLATVNHYYNSL